MALIDLQRMCEFCGLEFQAKEKNQRLCSLSCASKWGWRKSPIVSRYDPKRTIRVLVRNELGQRLCRRCGSVLVVGDNHKPYMLAGGHNICNRCLRADRFQRSRAIRDATYLALGGACACCGETTKEFLSVDHVQQDGAEHRRQLDNQTSRLHYELRRLGYPKDRFRLLCMNCNCSLGRYGYCPHSEAQAKRAITWR